MLLDIKTRAELLGPDDNAYKRNCEDRSPTTLGTIFLYKGSVCQVRGFVTNGYPHGEAVDGSGVSVPPLNWSEWEQQAEVLFRAPIDMGYSAWKSARKPFHQRQQERTNATA